MPQISVIVPAYKVEPYLHRCVDSILAQSFSDFELILVDDGSPDRCGAICDEYAKKDSRIVVIHQENGGLSAARNAGIDWVFANSESQWLTFIDSDDWVRPEYLERLLEAAAKTDCDLAVCGLLRTEGDPLPCADPALNVEKITADEFYCFRSGEHISPAAACAKLYRKDIFADLRFPVGRLHEDEFITYQTVYKAGMIALCPDLLYAYYTNPEGIMHSAWNPRRLDVLDAYQAQLRFAKLNHNEVFYQRVLYLMTLNITLQYLKVQAIQELRKYRKLLKKRLRKALRLAKPYRIFSVNHKKDHWIYWQAYPKTMQLLSWLKLKNTDQ